MPQGQDNTYIVTLRNMIVNLQVCTYNKCGKAGRKLAQRRRECDETQWGQDVNY